MALDRRLPWLRCTHGDVIVALSTRIIRANVLQDKQTRGLVVELLADILAEKLADFAAAGADTLDLRRREFDASARQYFGELFASSLAFLFLLFVVVVR